MLDCGNVNECLQKQISWPYDKLLGECKVCLREYALILNCCDHINKGL